MASIEINDDTARKLAELASAQGISVGEYVQGLVPQSNGAEMTVGQFEAELATVSFSGPTLPSDFSRADIYFDHD